MSSPAANLRKPKRSPLPQNRSRSVPFRHSLSRNEILNFLEEDPLGPSKSRPSVISSVDDFKTPDHPAQRRIVDGIRHHSHKNSMSQNNRVSGQHRSGGTPTDSELLASMASRLALVERELLAAKREVVEKDNHIRQLEERTVSLERSLSQERWGSRSRAKGEEDQQRQELELKCLALQKQVDDMEEFLNDYGMVWVGESGDDAHSKSLSNRKSTGDGVWVPVESVVDGGEFVVDFDAIVRNVKELNVLAGEGRSQVTTTTDKCAKLKPIDPIPLTLYKNGIVLFQGPFRPFTDPITHHCVQDLMDGYFPSELQSRFPNGVPFKLTDCRDVTFKPRVYADIFPGSGRQLGGEKGPSKLLPSGAQLRQNGKTGPQEKETSVLPGPKIPVDNFLTKLPASVVKGGRVLDVRAGVAEVLHGTSSKVTLVETPVLQEIRSRLDLSEDLRPPTPGHLTTLRIKSELGDKMYVLKMKYTETVGDVKQFIKKLRPPGSPQSFILKSNFPPRTFTKLSATLAECGLVPNANLFMAKSTQS